MTRVAVVGGCGRVGLPLGVRLQLAGLETTLIDMDRQAVRAVRNGRFPFKEEGGAEHLARALAMGMSVTEEGNECVGADVVLFAIGTPVDSHHNPAFGELFAAVEAYARVADPGALFVFCSTLYPGSTERLRQRLGRLVREPMVAFCPERVAEGDVLSELGRLPQIVAGCDERSFRAACQLFSRIAPSIIRLTPDEAEVAKLMANAWRYLEFAIANQFYMAVSDRGMNFHRLFHAIRHQYPRAESFKPPGFAAGPCLLKDTLQLAGFLEDRFHLGHEAVRVNEGLALFVTERLRELSGQGLDDKRVGLLGLAFKGESDDTRDSLSFKVKKWLEFHGADVLCHDPYVEGGLRLERVLERSDLLVICAPHRAYSGLCPRVPVVDVWGVTGGGGLEVFVGHAGGVTE